MIKKLCDLHTHSNCSDGADRPEDLIAVAESAGLRAVALTDHNSVAGLERFEAAAEGSSVIAVPGIEITAEYSGREVHIVGLFVGPHARVALSAYLEEMNKRKKQANHDMIERLRQDGYMIEESAVYDVAGDALPNRVHVAKELVRHGYVASINAAFKELLSEDGAYYRPARRLDAFEVIEKMSALSVVPVLAHPMISLDMEELNAFLPAAKEHGLVAMETLYSMYTAEQTAMANYLACRYGLLPSGGSDYHGANRPGTAMGSGEGKLAVPFAIYQDLKSCLD